MTVTAMQQRTSQLLYSYWNNVRNGRRAPRRFEIEPAKIARLLPETFILECGGPLGYRFRLAGTRICEQFGRELRGADLLDRWSEQDREALETLLCNVVTDCAVGSVEFRAWGAERPAGFEMLLLPLIHAGNSVNRVLGSVTAIDPPFWLGSIELGRQSLEEVNLSWPDGQPQIAGAPTQPTLFASPRPQPVGDPRRRFRVYDGGLAD